jgi:secretion/DNA translocation related TadE-like protein
MTGSASSRRIVGDDRGFTTIAAAFVIAGLATVLVLVVYVGAAVLARHRAQSAADLAALAAAVDHVGAGKAPCAAAGAIVEAHAIGGSVEVCRIEGEDVIVRVGVPVDLGPVGVRTATASARAGPAD